MTNLLKIFVFIITFTLNITYSVAAGSKYGYLQNISGSDRNNIYLIRNNKQVLVSKGDDILIGDRWEPKGKNIIIEYCDNSGLCNKTGREKSFFSTSKVKNIAWLTSLISDKVEYYAEQAVSRAKDDRNVARYGPTIYLAGMTEVPQDVFLGKRSLTFQWVHGAAPFSIKIMQLQEVVFKAETDQHHIQTNKINWRLGKYKVSIIDKHGKKESVMFNVIKRLLFAEQLFSFLEVDKNDNLKQYTYLGAMAMVDDGRYALEAYQQLLAISAHTPILKHLRKAIEAGAVFPELKSKDVIQRFLKQ